MWLVLTFFFVVIKINEDEIEEPEAGMEVIEM